MVDEETFELGGNIILTGFRNLMPGSMTIIKKIVGSYAKGYSEIKSDFQKLHLTMKTIHQTTDTPKNFHLNATVQFGGRIIAAETEDRNLFTGLDIVLKKVEKELQKDYS
jgi:ribosome-associated translation inhibitor RaiA